MKVWTGHDPSIGDEGVDLLLTQYDDDAFELAVRPGFKRTELPWSPPVQVEDVTP